MSTLCRTWLVAILLSGCKSSSSAPDAAAPDASPALADGQTGGDRNGAADAAVATDLPSALDVSPDLPPFSGDASAEAGPLGVGCDQDLSGTWDLLAARPGEPSNAAVLVLGANGFSYTGSGRQLEYLVGPVTRKAVWNAFSEHIPIAVKNTPATFATGALPVALGGSWLFSSEGQECAMTVSPTVVSAQCQRGDPFDPYIGGGSWPSSIPPLRTDRVYVVARMQPLSSVFGDLGGRWFARADPSSSNCAVTVEGNRITATCVTGDAFDGRTELTVGADCLASGTATGGWQIAGRRR
jgi:hypothetical protein